MSQTETNLQLSDQNLVWIDLEMTGLDPTRDRDEPDRRCLSVTERSVPGGRGHPGRYDAR